ncbi:suppressor APC domain-containing protein 2 [Macrosteles quadrilineatus]|uniref:suppressor APC domain-containing protein 2 n=1 Tax=Macrosteles quadrilineatus TaxID=74068 RepID=UPI0023E2C215|nr:suppressor APC domain-containing protein 2 [Macrosteles quadrilineatus]
MSKETLREAAMSPPLPQSATLDGLPKPFVGALRTLFDIMDDKGAGFVKFSEIERRWQDDGTKGLPKGVIESLRKVTPPNGLLSFERFCAGLKICLLRNQVESRQNRQNSDTQPIQPARPPSAPILDTDKPQWNSSNTATVRPNNAMPQQRTLSMPQLPGDGGGGGGGVKPVAPLYGPPKPPRTGAGLAPLPAPVKDKAEIRSALHNWQLGLLMGDTRRSVGDGKPAAVAEPQPQPHKKTSNRRREPRRHTLQNGIDYNMLKRMKAIEQEKEILMMGLAAVEKARDWYLKQVAVVNDKMKYLGRMPNSMDHWSEAHHERLELQRARVLEVNRHLAVLTESGGLPLHMNLAVAHPPLPTHLTRLKQQNVLLTEEVGKKSERISVLEREKAALLRELYQGQGRAPLRRSDAKPDAAAFM